ncbi:tetratricopeptide repeat protein [Streptomyces sp. NPDC006540]|uniref:ATP-binding protein n=1 Tax=Streptomyces sp. NPDC006540 TaxID=3155353 RepID=UPI0033B2DA16
MVHAEIFWAELRTVYETAGKPPLSQLRQNVGKGSTTVPGNSTLDDWLKGKTVPAEMHTAFFLALAKHLQQEAVQRSENSHAARSQKWWSDLLTLARLEKAKHPGGRPPRTKISEPSGPVMLPPRPHGFTGRTRELHQVLAGLEPDTSHDDDQADITVVASSVAGMAGIGKTALALEAAHQAHRRGWFPGGVLCANLRGYDQAAALDAGAAADRFLRRLGVKAKDIPTVGEDKCAVWQQELVTLAAQGRPLLIVLDNVRDPGQVEALLPGSPHRVLITSRQKLSSLPARRIALDPLTPGEALDLLERALRAGETGDTRTADEPAAAQKLVSRCGYLPLALRIIAALLRDQQTRPLDDLAQDLAEAQHRLKGMVYSGNDSEGRPMAVRASFELSYRHLNDAQALAFRLLSAAAGPDISTTAAQQLLNRPDARRLLDDLARAHLLDCQPQGRWAMHDLIRLFAGELGHQHAASDERHAAIGRLHQYYSTACTAAATHLDTVSRPRSPLFADHSTALAWLDAERPNLIETANTAPALGYPDTSTSLAFTLVLYLIHGRHFDDWITITTTALTVLRERGEQHREGVALTMLGLALSHVRRYDDAINTHKQAIAIHRERGDRHGEAAALNSLGFALSNVRRYEEAIIAQNQAVDLFRELGGRGRHGEGSALNGLGLALSRLSRYEEAIDAHGQAVDIFRELGGRHGEAEARNNLGMCLAKVRRYEEAVNSHNQAVNIHRELGERHDEGSALNNLGATLQLVGRLEEAMYAHVQAVDIYRELGDRHGEGDALCNLGAALQQVRRFEEAIDTYKQAVDIFRELGERHREGDALDCLSAALTEVHRFEEAINARTKAEDIFRIGDRHGEN